MYSFLSFYTAEQRRLEQIYIPGGFLHDLRDHNPYNIANRLDENGFTTDNCTGYNNLLFYNKMRPGTTTEVQLMNKLDDNLPTGTTQADYDALRQSFGY